MPPSCARRRRKPRVRRTSSSSFFSRPTLSASSRRSVSIWDSLRAAHHAETAALALQVSPGAHEARAFVGQLPAPALQAAFASAGAQGEDLEEDQAGAVQHLDAARPSPGCVAASGVRASSTTTTLTSCSRARSPNSSTLPLPNKVGGRGGAQGSRSTAWRTCMAASAWARPTASSRLRLVGVRKLRTRPDAGPGGLTRAVWTSGRQSTERSCGGTQSSLSADGS